MLERGNVAKNHIGKIGIILDIYHNVYTKTNIEIIQYKGIGFDGKLWTSETPTFLTSNIDEYITKKLKFNNGDFIMSDSVETEVAARSNRRFRVALRRVGRLEYLRGNITRDQWRNISDISWNPTRTTPDGEEIDLVDEVMREVQMNLIASGKVAVDTDFEAIDWDKLLAFLKELMPLILEFIQALLLIF